MIRGETTTEPDRAMQLRPRPADLPDFTRPPVNEVVLSIQFPPLTELSGAHIGLFWEMIRDEYPKVSEQAPLPPAFETFGGAPAIIPPFVQIPAFWSPPTSRFWLETADGRELVQVQQDRIIHNWRKREAEQEYPRYEAIRTRFDAVVKMFMSFVAAENLGQVRPNQCEVSYINAIEMPGEGNPYRQIDRITPWGAGRLAGDFPLELESMALQARFVLRRETEPYGRAHVAFTPAFLPPHNQPIVRLDITVRGKPRDASLEEALRLLDEEREIVVRMFAAVTTPEMWKIWGRNDGK